MTNEKPIITEAELDAEWERVCALSPEELKEELLAQGVDEIDLKAGEHRLMQSLDGIIFATPKSDYKM